MTRNLKYLFKSRLCRKCSMMRMILTDFILGDLPQCDMAAKCQFSVQTCHILQEISAWKFEWQLSVCCTSISGFPLRWDRSKYYFLQLLHKGGKLHELWFSYFVDINIILLNIITDLSICISYLICRHYYRLGHMY